MTAEDAERIPPRQGKMFRLSPMVDADRIPHMNESIHDRIRKQLERLDLSPQAASLKAGLSKDALRKLLANPSQMPHGTTLTKLATALETTEQWLLRGGDDSPSRITSDVSLAGIQMPGVMEMMKDVPVLGTAAASHGRGAFQLETHNIIDWARRPPALAGAKNVYSLYIEGDSMVPKYGPGELCFVNPHRPVRPGDPVVIQIQYSDYEPLEATVGLFRRRSSTAITIGKLNPIGDIDIPAENTIAVHRILEMHELFGL